MTDLKKDEEQQKAIYKNDDTQQELNKPLADPSGLDPKNKKFLDLDKHK